MECIGDQVGHVTLPIDRHSSVEQDVQVAQFPVVEVVHVPALVTEELVPAVFQGVELGFVTQVPLAEDTGGVAGVLQSARHHR